MGVDQGVVALEDQVAVFRIERGAGQSGNRHQIERRVQSGPWRADRVGAGRHQDTIGKHAARRRMEAPFRAVAFDLPDRASDVDLRAP